MDKCNNHSITRLVLISALFLATSCSSSQHGSSEIEKAKKTSTLSSTQITQPTDRKQTISITPSLEVTPIDPDISLINRTSFMIEVDDLTPLSEIDNGEYLALWNRENLQIDIVSWDGVRIPFRKIVTDLDLINEDNFLFILPSHVESTSKFIVFVQKDFISSSPNSHFYTIDIGTNHLHGWKIECAGSSTGEEFGDPHLVYRCSNNSKLWFIVNLDEPTAALKIEIPDSIIDPEELHVRSIDRNSITFDKGMINLISERYPWCNLNPLSLTISCKSFSYWIGRRSPNQEWAEIRDNPLFVTKIGVISTTCLDKEGGPCQPSWVVIDLPQNSVNELDSAWTLDSSQIILIASPVYTGDASYYWLYNVEENAIVDQWQQVGAYQFRLLSLGQPIWAPDGKHFIVERSKANEEPSEAGYLVSIEDWSHTLLWDGGVLLGVIQVP